MNRRALRRVRAAATFARQPRSRVAYLGWAGHGNVGDDSILAGQRVIRSGRPLPLVPVHDMDAVLRLAHRVRPDLRSPDILLGGGTLLGRPEWLRRLRVCLDSKNGAQLHVWGAGVEDPEFDGARSHVTSESLRDWADLLKSAPSVGVRGPRSREILAGLGVESEVVGDPALALRPAPAAVLEGAIALNLARTEDTYTGSSADWRSMLLDELEDAGHHVDLFTMDPGDVARAREIAASRPRLVRSVRSINDPQELVDWLASRQVVISERLHGSVLAAAAGRPFVSLDYRPKCKDFADSVAMGDYNLRVDRLIGGEVAHALAALVGSPESGSTHTGVVGRMTARVQHLRSALQSGTYAAL